MKRYLLFSAEEYENGGGWHDFEGDFGTVKEACVAGGEDGWWHVVDTDGHGSIVATGRDEIWIATASDDITDWLEWEREKVRRAEKKAGRRK